MVRPDARLLVDSGNDGSTGAHRGPGRAAPYHPARQPPAEVFFSAEDRQVCLSLLRASMDRYGLQVYAYCLMTNHIHLVAVPVNTGTDYESA